MWQMCSFRACGLLIQIYERFLYELSCALHPKEKKQMALIQDHWKFGQLALAPSVSPRTAMGCMRDYALLPPRSPLPASMH